MGTCLGFKQVTQHLDTNFKSNRGRYGGPDSLFCLRGRPRSALSRKRRPALTNSASNM